MPVESKLMVSEVRPLLTHDSHPSIAPNLDPDPDPDQLTNYTPSFSCGLHHLLFFSRFLITSFTPYDQLMLMILIKKKVHIFHNFFFNFKLYIAQA